MRQLPSVVALIGLLGAGPPALAASLDAESITRALGFSSADHERFLASKVVSVEIEETTEKQLAIGIALLTAASVDEIKAKIEQGMAFDIDPAVIQHTKVDLAKADASAFAGVSLPKSEVALLLDAAPGSDLNLSKAEIDQLRAVDKAQSGGAGDPAVAEAVNAAYRDVLAGRLQAYLADGLDGIAPYARDGEDSSAADDLRAAQTSLGLIEDAEPALFQAFADYPGQPLEGATHAFYWSEQRADDRPLFVLDHVMLADLNDRLFVLRRTFYVGHSYNASQVVAGVLSVAQGTAIFYGNRTSSDQVAGFMSSMRHKIGRGMMKDQLVAFYEKVQAELGQ